jgi:putative oxidoreductase
MNPLRLILDVNPIHKDLGLLILRVVVGLTMLLFHGWGKITGGVDRWAAIGSNMESVGITIFPAFWGFMAGFSEAVCSLLLILGLFFRPAVALLAFTMLVAALRHLGLPEGDPGSGWKGASHALELLAVYVALLLTGAGRFALGSHSAGSDRGHDPVE